MTQLEVNPTTQQTAAVVAARGPQRRRIGFSELRVFPLAMSGNVFERGRSASTGDGHGTSQLVSGHEVRRVRPYHRPEQAVREAADHTSDDQDGIVWCQRGEKVGKYEDDQHDDHQRLARVPPGEDRQRRRRQHYCPCKHRDEQAHLRLGYIELLRNLGQEAGGQKLTGHHHEDEGGKGEQAHPGKRFGFRGVVRAHEDGILYSQPLTTSQGAPLTLANVILYKL